MFARAHHHFPRAFEARGYDKGVARPHGGHMTLGIRDAAFAFDDVAELSFGIFDGPAARFCFPDAREEPLIWCGKVIPAFVLRIARNNAFGGRGAGLRRGVGRQADQFWHGVPILRVAGGGEPTLARATSLGRPGFGSFPPKIALSAGFLLRHWKWRRVVQFRHGSVPKIAA